MTRFCPLIKEKCKGEECEMFIPESLGINTLTCSSGCSIFLFTLSLSEIVDELCSLRMRSEEDE